MLPIVTRAASTLFGAVRSLRAGLTAPPATRGSGGWYPIIHESFTGAWQQNVETTVADASGNPTVYACVSLIASDIGKMPCRLVAEDADGIWTPLEVAAFSPVLRKPNRFQTRISFFQQWIISKLLWGNTYVLKVRDQRGVVVRLIILDPQKVTPLIAPDGSVYYGLNRDDLAGLPDDTLADPSFAVPSREIIHDLMVPLAHPLVGVSPIFACGLAALQGTRMQTNSAKLFANSCRPSGVLTAPGAISDETAARLKAYFETNFTGDNAGRVAVVGDGLKYEAMTMSPVDADLIKQLAWTDEAICRCFHVPRYKVEVGPDPNYNNINALDQQYYSQCLQILIESIELLLDEGLELPRPYGTEFDLDALMRMDLPTQVETEKAAIAAGFKAPNESRKRLNLAPVAGGETPYLQQQNYSLAALARRDAAEVPVETPAPPAPDETALMLEAFAQKALVLAEGLYAA